MRGITEERLMNHLRRLSREFDYNPDAALVRMLKQLISECTELTLWQPIDESTPKDRSLLVKFPDGQFEVARLVDTTWLSNDNLDYGYGSDIPTHFCELPEDPK